ncbi:MAG: hypothetical protein QM778_04035 [Myxococcales bacterium]
MSVLVRDRHGDTLALVGFDGKQFDLIGPRAFAPGQPLVLEMPLGPGYRLELKSTGSRKRSDGRFDIRARATTLAKGAREALDQAFAQAKG